MYDIQGPAKTSASSFKEAGKVFLLSRAIILFITYLGVSRFPLSKSAQLRNCGLNINDCLIAWNRWDAQAYVYIAQHGYAKVQYTAFFPLWPLLERIVGQVFGGSGGAYYLAGVILANSFFYFALVLLYALLCADFDEGLARVALFFLAFYPFALFFFAGYTESLFLLLSVAVFLCLRQENPWYWWLAGVLGMLAVLTRSTGIVTEVPFFILAAQRFWRLKGDSETNWFQKIHMFLPMVLIPFGLVIYMLYLWHSKGNPLIFSVEEKAGWQRHLSFPWTGMVETIGLLLQSPYLQAIRFADVLFTLLPIGILIVGWRRLPLQYSLFAAIVMLLSLLYPVASETPLTSAPRYMMGAFPIVISLASWAKQRPFFDRVYVATALPLFTLNVILFISHYWAG